MDHVDLAACRKRGIAVSNAAGYSTNAVAELVFGLAIGLYRSIPACDHRARTGGTKDGLVGPELHGKTMGIVGTGAIGRRVAAIASAFGCKLLAYSRTEREEMKALAAELMAQKLSDKGCPKVIVHDLARCDMAKAVEDAFRYGKLVLATTTYNADVFPFMRTFIEHLTERNYQNRTVALIENGSWAPLAAKVMKGMFEKSKNITFVGTPVTIRSALSAENREQLGELAKELCREYAARDSEMADKHDMSALFRIGYGLYVVTSNDGKRDNGLIVNTVTQVSDNPNRIAVNINKANYSHHVIKQTGILNVNCLSVDAPFKVFETFGFQSGRTADKFAGVEELRSDNGLRFLPRYINSFMSLKVESYVDLDTHGMFICSVTEARVISDRETMTYTYYQNNVKPKPETEGKHGFVCKICGWIYEGDTLPDDIVCPLCKHGAADFEPIG